MSIVGSSAADLYFPDFDEPVKKKRRKSKTSEQRMVFAQADLEPARREKIKVISVGGGGSNALNHIITKGVEGVDLLAVNTDVRCLEMSQSPNKIVLGEKATKGLGAGALPEVGAQAARESISEIRDYLKGSDMVYLTAGLGGGTGTGALPIIAETAKEMDILTVAVVTKPFSFEGRRRMSFAQEGIEKLRSCVDALIVVPNDKLLEICDKDTEINDSFAMADEVLRQAVIGVTDLITKPGVVNVDFADLRSVMKKAGLAVMGVGRARGENRIQEAIKMAMESPLMECPMNGASGVLMNITCGKDLGILEIQEAASYVENVIADDATFVWGCVEDEAMAGEIQVVVIATGFDDVNGQKFTKRTPAQQTAPAAPVFQRPVKQEEPELAAEETETEAEPEIQAAPVMTAPSWLTDNAKPEPTKEKEEFLDVEPLIPLMKEGKFDTPTFIRKRNRAPKKD